MNDETQKLTFSLIKRMSPYFCVILFVVAFLPYISGINGEFVFDDMDLIKNDPFYVTESNPLQCWNRSFWKASRTQGMYRPLTLFSYWVEARIFAPFTSSQDGLFSPGFRFTNLILHIITTILVFKLAERLRFGRITAFIAAMIFAVHPIHVEAVTPAFGRGELLCAMFMFAGLLLHTYRDRSLWYSVAAAFSFMFSFMAKEHGVAFLPILLIIDFFICRCSDLNYLKGIIDKRGLVCATGDGRTTEGRGSKPCNTPSLHCSNLIKPYLIYILPVVIVFWLRWWRLGSLLPQQQFFDRFIDNNIANSPWYLMFVSAVRIHGIALLKFIYPSVLSCDYSYARLLPSKSIFDGYAFLTLFLFITIPAVFAYFSPRDRKKVFMLVCIYIISILPAGNFIVPSGTIFAERLQYIPSLCLVIFFALVFMRISRFMKPPVPMVVFLALFLAMFGRCMLRTLDWKDGLSLWSSAVIATPDSCKTWVNYATSIGDRKNSKNKKEDYIEAVNACTRSLDIHPRYASAYANRGLYLAKLGMVDKAEADLRTAIKLSSLHKMANYHLGVLLANKGKIKEARKIWLWLQEMHPNDKLIKNALKQSEKDLKK